MRAPPSPLPGRRDELELTSGARARRTKLVIDKLEDPDVDEDEMPDALKATLNALLVLPDSVRPRLLVPSSYVRG